MNRPIIQGGMGVYISTPFLAKLCSMNESVLGTVSCVASEKVLARILQSGDHGGHYRRALSHFPFSGVAEHIIEMYFVEGGIGLGQKYKSVPVFNMHQNEELTKLTVASSFAMVWLTKEGHSEPVSMNLLEKIQGPLMPQIYGAMLAGVDFVTMGAGITLQIPGVLDAFSKGEPACYRVSVADSKDGTVTIHFNPRDSFGVRIPELVRPGFLPIDGDKVKPPY